MRTSLSFRFGFGNDSMNIKGIWLIQPSADGWKPGLFWDETKKVGFIVRKNETMVANFSGDGIARNEREIAEKVYGFDSAKTRRMLKKVITLRLARKDKFLKAFPKGVPMNSIEERRYSEWMNDNPEPLWLSV